MITKPPFSTAKKLISSGHINTLSDLLETINKTPLAKAMKTSPERFNKLLENPELFMFKDAYKIAEIIGVDNESIVKIIAAEYKGKKR
jgi:plasmid maintenance system antidote protein VapI